jgi:hypothetical protein
MHTVTREVVGVFDAFFDATNSVEVVLKLAS